MKSLLCVFCVLISGFSIAQQRYISSAIIAFSGGAYERSIKDINTALADESKLSDEEKSKAYFYRGLASKKMQQSNSESEVLSDPAIAAYKDFKKVESLGVDSWVQRSQKELQLLLIDLKIDARSKMNEAQASQSNRSKINLLSSALKDLNATITIVEDYETYQMMGETYLAFGDTYMEEDAQRSTANFRAALRYLEAATRLNNDCEFCVDALINVSVKLNDNVRVKRYTQIKSTFD